jgi:hypothetical protein
VSASDLRGYALLLDYLVAAKRFDDVFAALVDVAGDDEEARRMLPDLGVVVKPHFDDLGAGAVAALADERARVEAAGVWVGDACAQRLISRPERHLIKGDPFLSAAGFHGWSFSVIPVALTSRLRDTRCVPYAVRAAKNESIYREVNERIRELQERFENPEHVQFVCECSRLGCTQAVRATLEEYSSLVRTSPRRFLVACGHVDPEIERVIAETDNYAVVEKIGLAGDTAEETAA